MFTGLLKHMPPPASTAKASPSASEQNSNAQTTVPTIPRGHLVVGPNDQLHLLTPVGRTATSNHYTIAHAAKQPGGDPQPNDEDDGGGRKKKRKKKDRRQWARDDGESQGRDGGKPKRRKEEREPLVVTLRRSKEPREAKGRREPRARGQDGRKGNETPVKNVPGAAEVPRPAPAPVKVPGKRGRKPKVKVLPPVSTSEGIQVHTAASSSCKQAKVEPLQLYPRAAWA